MRAALTNYVQTWSKRVDIHAELHTSGLLDDRLPSEAETTLYRIAQEALTNVAKHSRATNVEVILERRPDHVLLIVEDDGVGFDYDCDERRPAVGSDCRACRSGPRWAAPRSKSNRLTGKGTTILVRMASHDPGNACGRRGRIMSKTNAPLRILLADDHVTVRHGLKLLIDSQPDMKVVSEVSDGEAAVRGALALKPDVVVMDISMPGMNGLDATQEAEATTTERGNHHADAA